MDSICILSKGNLNAGYRVYLEQLDDIRVGMEFFEKHKAFKVNQNHLSQG